MLIRTYADIAKLEGEDALSEAEKKLVEHCERGELTILGSGTRPKRPSQARTIRADLLRYLILGGCDQCRVHEKGVQLRGAWIAGGLDLSFGSAKGAVHLLECAFEAPFAAYQASFDRLVLNGSSLPGLNAQGCTIKGDVLLDNMQSSGEVSFSGAEIGGQLIFNDAELYNAGHSALQAEGASIRGDVFLSEMKSSGEVSLAGAAIGGQLNCTGATLNGGNSDALKAYNASISGGVFLRKLKSCGEVSFSYAEIGGIISCTGAELDGGDEGHALNVSNATIKGSVFLDNVKSNGEVSFAGAAIVGQLCCDDADLKGGKRKALNAAGTTINGDVFLHRLTSNREVSFSGATIEGQISFYGAELNGNKAKALNGQSMTTKTGFFWRDVKSVNGTVDLSAAHLNNLADDAASWHLVSNLILVGTTYENLIGPFDLDLRKAWLRRGSEPAGQFHPQPYQQLAKFYRETGHRYEAREILVAKEIEQRKATRKAIREGKARTESWLIPGVLVFLNLVWDWATRLIAGYGYKPWLSLWWLGGLVTVMMISAQLTWNAGDFAPNSAVVLTSQDWKTIADGPSENPAADWSDALAPGKDYETFYSFAYALDVVVPVLDLGQTDAWAPSPARGDWGYWMFYLQKIFIVLGWVVTAIAAAAISGMIRRDD
jgi:uncharacterized protein YjbI with pentapeptide repeats